MKNLDEENPFHYVEILLDSTISIRICGAYSTQENFDNMTVKLFKKDNPIAVSIVMDSVYTAKNCYSRNKVGEEFIPIMIQYKGEEMKLALARLHNSSYLTDLFDGFRFSEENAFKTTVGEVAEKYDIDIP